MDAQLELKAIATELDAIHVVARRAFLARDLDAYRGIFTEDVRYRQPDGKVIGRAQLMRDVATQLAQFKSVDSELIRETITQNDDGTVSQVARQLATYSLSVFLVFTKTWKIERHAKYSYRYTAEGWRVCDVEVLAESVRSKPREKQIEK